jgi:ribokinase
MMTPTRTRPKILVIGSANTDMIVRTARLPGPGETVLGGDFRIAAGGKGANQAVAAARAGGAVTFIARVGNDDFGAEAIAGYRRDGIETKFIRAARSRSTGVALIVVDRKGENSIAVASGANADLAVEDIRRAAGVLASADMLLIQLESPIKTVGEAIRKAARIGLPVILNPAPVPADLIPAELYSFIDFLTPNITEAGKLTRIAISGRDDLRRAAGRLLKKMSTPSPSRNPRSRAVLITLGAAGVFVAADGIETIVPGFKVRAVDTTAAGDVFNGALAVALAEGRPLLEAVRFAAAAAAISVTRMGAQPSAPGRGEILRFLKPHGPTSGKFRKGNVIIRERR